MRIAVTGASGFIGAEVVRVMLDRGHEVHGTVRDTMNAVKCDPLTALRGASDRLELFTADLMDAGSFHAAFEGCDVVMHVASPYIIDVEDPQRDLVDPALKGSLDVLEAANEAGVGRVVLTSSAAAITDEPEDRVYTEADWNTKSSLTRNPYYYSKTLAERAAWDYVQTESRSFDLVVINPAGVIGPSLPASVNASNQIIADLLNGGVYPGIINLSFPFVDVRDVAIAHVEAALTTAASGRYICANEVVSVKRMVDVLRAGGFDDYPLPKIDLTSTLGTFVTKQAARLQKPGARAFLRTNLGKVLRLDTSKITDELGIEFRDMDQSIIETAHDLVSWAHVTPRT